MLCARPQQKHNTPGSDITLLYEMYIQYKMICVISTADTSSESVNRGAMGTIDNLTKSNKQTVLIYSKNNVFYHIHIYMMSPQTGPRPKQTGSLSHSHVYSPSFTPSLPPSLPSGMCQSNLHNLLGHKWLMGLLSRFTKQ